MLKRHTYTIKIPQIKLFGYHGCYDKEKKEGQEFEVGVQVVFSSRAKDFSCIRLEDCFDYTKIVLKVREIFSSKRCDTLEELTRDIGDKLFHAFNGKESVCLELIKVNIKKFKPKGMSVPYVEVECLTSSE